VDTRRQSLIGERGILLQRVKDLQICSVKSIQVLIHYEILCQPDNPTNYSVELCEI
jgi:hypothetical protein